MVWWEGGGWRASVTAMRLKTREAAKHTAGRCFSAAMSDDGARRRRRFLQARGAAGRRAVVARKGARDGGCYKGEGREGGGCKRRAGAGNWGG